MLDALRHVIHQVIGCVMHSAMQRAMQCTMQCTMQCAMQSHTMHHAMRPCNPHTIPYNADLERLQAGGALGGPRLAPEYKPLQVWVGSWNANSLEPPFTPDKLRNWLLPARPPATAAPLGGAPGPFEYLAATPRTSWTASSSTPPPTPPLPPPSQPREAECDLYVIGFQELPDAQRGGISDAVPRLGHVRLGARATQAGSGKRHTPFLKGKAAISRSPTSASAASTTAGGGEQSSPRRRPLCERSAWRGGKGRESGRGRESRVVDEVAMPEGPLATLALATGRGSEEASTTPRAEGDRSGKRGASAKPTSPSVGGEGGKQRERESHVSTPRGYAEMATVLSEVQPPSNRKPGMHSSTRP